MQVTQTSGEVGTAIQGSSESENERIVMMIDLIRHNLVQSMIVLEPAW